MFFYYFIYSLVSNVKFSSQFRSKKKYAYKLYTLIFSELVNRVCTHSTAKNVLCAWIKIGHGYNSILLKSRSKEIFDNCKWDHINSKRHCEFVRHSGLKLQKKCDSVNPNPFPPQRQYFWKCLEFGWSEERFFWSTLFTELFSIFSPLFVQERI